MSNDIRRITLKADKAIGITKPFDGSSVQGVAFNLAFIAQKNPTLAVSILELYQQASTIDASDPAHPDEDYTLAFDELKKLFK